ncbi:MAG: VanZ family protein [Ornithobacterium rhinotracheale]|nr:VanZ family protein [Ornithobacterium rhinotracheale]
MINHIIDVFSVIISRCNFKVKFVYTHKISPRKSLLIVLYKEIFSPIVGLTLGLRLLLVPFNSFIYFNELDSLWEKFWVVGQNIANVFLLYPLGICIHILWDRWSGLKKSLLLGFSMSAFIEVTQLLLDLLFFSYK